LSLNNPLSYIDPSGLWTLQGGASFSGTIWGISGNLGFGIAFDDKGNIAPYASWALGSGFGAGFVAGGQIQQSDAESVCDLAGPFNSASIGVGEGTAGSIEFFNGFGSNGQPVVGKGFTLGAGVGAGGSITRGPTHIPIVFHPPSAPAGY
jgi:hypothetical protein